MISPLPEPDREGFLTHLTRAASDIWSNLKRTISTPFGQQTESPKSWTNQAGDQYTESPKTGTQVIFNKPTTPPLQSPTPTATPMPNNYMNYNQVANIPQNVPMWQPSDEIAKLLLQNFPNEATQSAIVSRFESHFNPKAISEVNNDGSRDYGLFQINSNTFFDLLSRRPKQMQEAGAKTLNDLLDPFVNIKVAKIIKGEEDYDGKDPWSRWYGWQNQGITWNNQNKSIAGR